MFFIFTLLFQLDLIYHRVLWQRTLVIVFYLKQEKVIRIIDESWKVRFKYKMLENNSNISDNS